MDSLKTLGNIMLIKKLGSVILLISVFSFLNLGCTGSPNKSVTTKKDNTSTPDSSPSIFTTELNTMQQSDSIIDPRDGEIYATITIGNQTWMAENLRYDAKGSWLNPDFPSSAYGRLYDRFLAQTVCPSGWHLPSDTEWNKMEMSLGMSLEDAAKTFWRGSHGASLKSEIGWMEDGNGNNSSGFNGLPSGFYFLDSLGGEFEYGGSAGFWASMEEDKAWLRFLGGPLDGVNRFDDNKTAWGLACRCVKD